ILAIIDTFERPYRCRLLPAAEKCIYQLLLSHRIEYCIEINSAQVVMITFHGAINRTEMNLLPVRLGVCVLDRSQPVGHHRLMIDWQRLAKTGKVSFPYPRPQSKASHTPPLTTLNAFLNVSIICFPSLSISFLSFHLVALSRI